MGSARSPASSPASSGSRAPALSRPSRSVSPVGSGELIALLPDAPGVDARRHPHALRVRDRAQLPQLERGGIGAQPDQVTGAGLLLGMAGADPVAGLDQAPALPDPADRVSPADLVAERARPPGGVKQLLEGALGEGVRPPRAG